MGGHPHLPDSLSTPRPLVRCECGKHVRTRLSCCFTAARSVEPKMNGFSHERAYAAGAEMHTWSPLGDGRAVFQNPERRTRALGDLDNEYEVLVADDLTAFRRKDLPVGVRTQPARCKDFYLMLDPTAL